MVNSKMNVYNLFASWWVEKEMHTRKNISLLYFLLEIIKNSYENKNRKRGCYWPQAWCWEFFFFNTGNFFPRYFLASHFFPSKSVCRIYVFWNHPYPPPSKVKWYESWVWSLMFDSAKHALQKGISSLGWKKREFLLVAFNYIHNKRQPFLPFSLVGAGRSGEVLSIMTCAGSPFSASGKWTGKYFISWILWIKVTDICHLGL